MLYDLPNSLPVWANSISAAIEEPPQEIKESGWVADDRPPAEWLNWWQNRVHSWAACLYELSTMWATNLVDQTPSNAVDFVGVATDGNLIILLETNRYIQYTYDCINYTRVDLTGNDTDLTSIEFGDGKWAITTAKVSGNLYYSTNPTASWTKVSKGSDLRFYSIKYADGYWVVSARNEADTTGYIMFATSLTGTFGATHETSDTFRTVCHGGGYWVVSGYDGVLLYKLGTPVGTFTEVAIGSANIFGLEYGLVDGVGRWICSNANNGIYTADVPSGTWTQRTSAAVSGSYLPDIAYGFGLFFITCSGFTGPSKTHTLQYSRDCITWKLLGHKANTYGYYAAKYCIDRFVFAGDSGVITTSLKHGNFTNSL